MLNRFLYTSENVFVVGGSMDRIGCVSEHGYTSWIGLDWVSEFVDWVGLDLSKWTPVQLWDHPDTYR